MQDKDKRISQLRAILGQAKQKIDSLKAELIEKDKLIQRLKFDNQKKIKNLQQDQGQIMKQYQQRMIRIQKSLQDSDSLVSKYQKLSQSTSKTYQLLSQSLNNLSNLINKNFIASIIKDNNQAVQELCCIQKCKDFDQRLQKFEQNQSIQQITKSIRKITSLVLDSIKKKRQIRLGYLKKQSNYQQQIQDQQKYFANSKSQIEMLKNQLKNMQQKYQKKIQTIAKSKAKVVQEKTNLQFIKQLLIKVLLGPKEATIMAFQVLSKVLKFSPDQYKICHKKIQ